MHAKDISSIDNPVWYLCKLLRAFTLPMALATLDNYSVAVYETLPEVFFCIMSYYTIKSQIIVTETRSSISELHVSCIDIKPVQ